MKRKIGDCDHCTKKHTPIFKSSPLKGNFCYGCNQQRLSKPKKKKFPNLVKNTGQLDLFYEIWAERPHVSFLSSIQLEQYRYKFVSMFAHVLSKALNKYPKFKLNKENIILLTPEEHTLLDHGWKEQRLAYAKRNKCDWEKVYGLREQLKLKYEAEYGSNRHR